MSSSIGGAVLSCWHMPLRKQWSSNSFLWEGRLRQIALKEIQLWDEMDMILMQIGDTSLPLFSEARMINGVQAQETWVNFNKLCGTLKDMICELYFLRGPFPSMHHKYAHWLQNETENSVLALNSLIPLRLRLTCLCMSHPLLWIIYRRILFIS